MDKTHLLTLKLVLFVKKKKITILLRQELFSMYGQN